MVLVVVGANDVAPLADDWQDCPASCWDDALGQLDAAGAQAIARALLAATPASTR